MVEVKFSNLNSAQLHILADAVGEMENLGNPELVQKTEKKESKESKVTKPAPIKKIEPVKEESAPAPIEKEIESEPKPVKVEVKTITKSEARELVNAKITKAIDSPSAAKIRGENNKAIKEKLAEYDVKGISDLTGDQIQEFKDFVNTLQDVK